MKRLILLLFALVWFSACNTKPVEIKKDTKVEAIATASDAVAIDSVITDEINGKTVQVVFLKDGKQMLFSENYFNISQADDQINYLIFRQSKKYRQIKDSLKTTSVFNNADLELFTFNLFLKDQGLKIVKESDFKSFMQIETIKTEMSLLKQAYFYLFLAFVLFLIVFVVSMMFAARAVTKSLQEGNVLLMSKGENTC